jgi:flagellar biogenesis protein FliO
MKTQYLEVSVAAQRAPRIFARSGAPLQAPSGMRQLADLPGEASLISLQNAKELCTGACMNAGQQLVRAWRNASSLLSQARANARAWTSRAWKTSLTLISRVFANSIKQSSCTWKRLRAQQIARSNSKRLHVAETVSLGEKRFVAVVKVDGQEFLIGGGATNVALLARLGAKKPLKAEKTFDGILTEEMTVSKKQTEKRVRKKVTKPSVEKPGRDS